MSQTYNRKILQCHKRFQNLIEFAVREGWKVTITHRGHLRITKRSACIYTGTMEQEYDYRENP